MPPLDQKYAEGAHYAAKNTSEHKDLHTRALVNGEFAVFDVDGTKDQIFTPKDVDPHNAFVSYCVEKSAASVKTELVHVPWQWQDIEKGNGSKRNNSVSILGRLGLKRSKK